MLGVRPATTRRTMTDDAAALLAAYDAQLRGAAEVQGSGSWDRSGPLWRAKFSHGGFVSYETLEGVADVDALIAETVAYFAGDPAMRGVRVEDPRPRLAARPRRPARRRTGWSPRSSRP